MLLCVSASDGAETAAAGTRAPMTDQETEQQPPVDRATVRGREKRTAWLLWAGLALVVLVGLVWLLPFGLF
jgi:hypothetical protein